VLPSLSGPPPVAALPSLIQGGMGVAVSSWLLASAVARRGHLGVVSGTALDLVLARRLQDGDVDGSARRAIAAFPVRELAQRVLTRYLRVGGRAGAPYRPVPRPSLLPRRAAQELTVLANFVEVWLAKEGHQGRVGVNYLEKIQLATPAAAYGAMLAGVDAVLMGAGIPRHLPRLLDALARHRKVRLPVDVAGGGDPAAVELDPADLLGPDPADLPELRRPVFLAIVSSDALAAYLNKDAEIRPDGFVVEAPCAGGHNAPPRGRVVLDERGQPQFGPRDNADVAKIAAVGLPFWLAGGQGTPEALRDALAAGAVGVQVGTPFALCSESGLAPELRARLLATLRDGTLEVLTDADASPTGFPFKVAQLEGSLSDRTVRAARPRLCDLGYLRTPYRKGDGGVGYRCPAEPVDAYVGKGGQAHDAEGSVCLCNALTADVGLGQVDPDGRTELPLVTLGADLAGARRLAALHPEGWSADDAIDWLLVGATTSA
jgi:NAD(P)H-dependent flavin oxidoreductase YrpB (nitropropane dioxygenase family)